MKKSLVALLMALVMMMTCVSALAVEGPEQDMSIFPLSDEKITVTMMHAYTDVMPSDWSTVWFWIYLLSVLICSNVNLLKPNSIIQALFIDDNLQVVTISGLTASKGEGIFATYNTDIIPSLRYGLFPESNLLGQTIIVLCKSMETMGLFLVEL